MIDTFHTVRVETGQQINEVVHLAETIWHEHFTPIIGTDQVNYMLDKFQSAPALKQQLKDGYEYYQLFDNGQFCGYCGVHPENGKLLLSKLYIKREFRGRHLASKAFHFLTKLCKERGLVSIWLTCNKQNHDSLAVYRHLGFKTVDTQAADIGCGYVMDDYIMEYTIS